MANSSLFSLLIACCLAAFALGECPNACSAHGKCGAYDMCTCYRNWMANDCSERICQFGIAHVDSPKGDLDSSGGALSGPDTTVVVNDQIWPYGTTELYPDVTDMNGNVLSNTAHEYRECSNKGICDRQTGTCACFEGYEGSACQRASCPSNANGVCSGHGTCQTIKEIAWNDFQNVYELWDQDATMGCVCDGGYTGPDCSERRCKVGVDPLYYDNNATARFANWTYQFYTMASGAAILGNYSLIFTDAHNQEWETEPIPYGASCANLATYLESLPNNVIPKNSVRCNMYTLTGTGYTNGQKSGVDPIVDTNMYVDLKYTIVFPSNPGRLAQIRINKYLDGNRPTLYTNEDTTSTLGWHIYPNGYTGEYVDLVPDRCFDVMVNVNTGDSASWYTNYLGDLTGEEAKLLKTCLGDADGNSANNVEVYNWDHGSYYNPHLIKLQEATQYVPSLRTEIDATTGVYDLTSYDPTLYPVPTSYICANADINANLYGSNQCSNKNPPGFYAVLFYDDKLLNPFRLFTNPSNNYGTSTQFYVYTTTGYLNLVNVHSSVFTDRWTYSTALAVKSHYSNVLGVIPDSDTQYATSATSNPMAGFTGDMSCDVTPIGTYQARDCFNKGDWAMFFNARNSTAGEAANPTFPNLYRIAKLYTNQKMLNNTLYPEPEEPIGRVRLVLDYNMNAQFKNKFDGASGGGGITDTTAQAYKFHPPTTATGYPRGGRVYASQCSGRGLCNTDSGVCECFGGYTGDDCSCQFAQAQ